MAYYIGILIRLLQPANDLCYQTKGYMKLKGTGRYNIKNDCYLTYSDIKNQVRFSSFLLISTAYSINKQDKKF